MRAYFSRKTPFYLLTETEAQDSAGFDAAPVIVDDVVMANVRSVRRLVEKMEAMFNENPAYEESAQYECNALADEVRRIFKTKAQDNRNE